MPSANSRPADFGDSVSVGDAVRRVGVVPRELPNGGVGERPPSAGHCRDIDERMSSAWRRASASKIVVGEDVGSGWRVLSVCGKGQVVDVCRK